MERTYLCIDLKTFYASVECAERGLDPFRTNLVVADDSRGKGALCLAISPAMKELGIHNRCRLFEIPSDVKYIVAKPRMKKYIEYSANIYAIYLKYIAKEDIHPYSIDEMFMDITTYLKMYKKTPVELAQMIMDDILATTHITATAGIGTNLFLTKVALDITAKHVESHIGYLNEEIYKKTLWEHEPITDFWMVGRGTQNRLLKYGVTNMKGITMMDPKVIEKEFGINGLYLLDHANGIEPTTIADIKKYKSKGNSISQGQVLFEDYTYEKTKIIVKEMTDVLSLDLIDKELVTNQVGLMIVYSDSSVKATGGSVKLTETTNVYSYLVDALLSIYESTTHRDKPIRGVNISFGNVISDDNMQYDLFTDIEARKKEHDLEVAMNELKHKFGKNKVLRGMNLDTEAGANQIKRNKLIGGHNSGEE